MMFRYNKTSLHSTCTCFVHSCVSSCTLCLKSLRARLASASLNRTAISSSCKWATEWSGVASLSFFCSSSSSWILARRSRMVASASAVFSLTCTQSMDLWYLANNWVYEQQQPIKGYLHTIWDIQEMQQFSHLHKLFLQTLNKFFFLSKFFLLYHKFCHWWFMRWIILKQREITVFKHA